MTKSENWRVRSFEQELAKQFSTQLNLPEVISQVLVARGFQNTKQVSHFLSRSMNDLRGPSHLQGIDAAAKRVSAAIRSKEKLIIHGDFDADGITSTAVLARFLLDMGANAIPYIPNRLQENHGLSAKSLEVIQKENVKLVITCDCGVSNAKEIAELHALGIETIVTDHHTIPDVLPKSAIIVNPKLSDDMPEDLSGVGVAFMLIVAIRAQLRTEGHFENRAEPNLREYLDIVALGTLADMAPLRGENRILVHHGLKELFTTRRSGIVAMKLSAGLSKAESMDVDDVGFRLAPRINAAARLGHSDEALELLMTTDSTRADQLAAQLEKWNLERRAKQEEMTRHVMDEARRQVEMGKRSIVVGSHNFHPGIIGLVAQKISQTFFLPTFVFSTEGGKARGSARSASGVNIVELLDECAPMLMQYGGHEEAGGCTLESGRLPEFAKRLEEVLAKKNHYAAREILVDAQFNLRHLSRELVVAFDTLKPFGVGNPKPLLLSGARVTSTPREVGQGHLKMMLSDPTGSSPFSAIGFGLWKSTYDSIKDVVVDVVYTPELNRFEGRESVQLNLQGVRSV